jgi:hypothetical protein
MNKYVRLVEETKQIEEANKNSTIGEKIVALLYGDSGSYMLKPGMFNKMLGAVGKVLGGKPEWQRDMITLSTKWGNKLVEDMLEGQFEDFTNLHLDTVAKGIRKVVIIPIISKYVSKAVIKNTIDQETKHEDDNYVGWGRYIGDDDGWKEIYKKARPELEKAITKHIEKNKGI